MQKIICLKLNNHNPSKESHSNYNGKLAQPGGCSLEAVIMRKEEEKITQNIFSVIVKRHESGGLLGYKICWQNVLVKGNLNKIHTLIKLSGWLKNDSRVLNLNNGIDTR